MGIRVKAKSVSGDGRVVGYMNHQRIREGDEFVIENEKAFAPSWMDMVDVPEAVPAPKVEEPKSEPALKVEEPKPAEPKKTVLGGKWKPSQAHGKASTDEDDELDKGEST